MHCASTQDLAWLQVIPSLHWPRFFFYFFTKAVSLFLLRLHTSVTNLRLVDSGNMQEKDTLCMRGNCPCMYATDSFFFFICLTCLQEKMNLALFPDRWRKLAQGHSNIGGLLMHKLSSHQHCSLYTYTVFMISTRYISYTSDLMYQLPVGWKQTVKI